MSDDLAFTPATALAAAFRTGELSPVEVVQALLARIDTHEPRINAFAHVTPELALDMARAAADAFRKDEALSPLHGVPVTIKDLFDIDAGPYSETDKSVERRRRFCEKHAGGYARLESQCPHYRDLVVKLADLAA